jgi:predicted kinase
VELIVFIGLQASGKSSFYRARFAATHIHVSMDNFRSNRNPRQRQLVLLEEALLAGQPVVIDNTNATAEERAPLIERGKVLGARVVGYYFESRLADCVERNRQRQGKACVPDVALYTTVKRLQRPTFGEGFDQLFHVRMDGNGGWEVSEWQGPSAETPAAPQEQQE